MKVDQDNIKVFSKNPVQANPYPLGESEYLDGSGLYCEHVIKTESTLNIANALLSPEWDNNPDLKLNMVAYFGMPIMGVDNSPFGTVCILDTKQHQFSQTTIELLETIKLSFEIQIKQLHQQTLAQKQQAQEEQAHLIRGISHQINTPLGVSITTASVIASTIDNICHKMDTQQLDKPTLSSELTNIKQSIELLSKNLNITAKRVSTLQDLLASEHLAPLNMYPLNQLIERFFQGYHGEFHRRQIQYKISPANITAEVFTVPILLQQVLDILCRNALEHGLSDVIHPKIEIAVTDHQQHIKLHFFDNGQGINKEQNRHLFTPFYTKNKATDFAGLGLSVAKRILTQQLHGDIQLQQTDVGAHFVISLPKLAM